MQECEGRPRVEVGTIRYTALTFSWKVLISAGLSLLTSFVINGCTDVVYFLVVEANVNFFSRTSLYFKKCCISGALFTSHVANILFLRIPLS